MSIDDGRDAGVGAGLRAPGFGLRALSSVSFWSVSTRKTSFGDIRTSTEFRYGLVLTFGGCDERYYQDLEAWQTAMEWLLRPIEKLRDFRGWRYTASLLN